MRAVYGAVADPHFETEFVAVGGAISKVELSAETGGFHVVRVGEVRGECGHRVGTADGSVGHPELK